MSAPSNRRPDLADVPAFALFVALLAIVFLQFFTRYVLNDSLGWTEEIARYLLIAVAYVGAVGALRKGEHLFLEVVYRRARIENLKPLAVGTEVLGVVYHLVLGLLAVQLARVTDQRMVSVDAPKALVYFIVGAAIIACAGFAIARVRRRWRQSPEEILAELEASSSEEAAG